MIGEGIAAGVAVSNLLTALTAALAVLVIIYVWRSLRGL